MLAYISACSGVIGFKVGTWLCPVREKVRPACPKRPKNAVLRRVGRTFSRKCRWRGRVGRTISRVSCWKPRAGRTLSRMLALRLM